MQLNLDTPKSLCKLNVKSEEEFEAQRVATPTETVKDSINNISMYVTMTKKKKTRRAHFMHATIQSPLIPKRGMDTQENSGSGHSRATPLVGDSIMKLDFIVQRQKQPLSQGVSRDNSNGKNSPGNRRFGVVLSKDTKKSQEIGVKTERHVRHLHEYSIQKHKPKPKKNRSIGVLGRRNPEPSSARANPDDKITDGAPEVFVEQPQQDTKSLKDTLTLHSAALLRMKKSSFSIIRKPKEDQNAVPHLNHSSTEKSHHKKTPHELSHPFSLPPDRKSVV